MVTGTPTVVVVALAVMDIVGAMVAAEAVAA
jgi:hypothetical protein